MSSQPTFKISFLYWVIVVFVLVVNLITVSSGKNNSRVESMDDYKGQRIKDAFNRYLQAKKQRHYNKTIARRNLNFKINKDKIDPNSIFSTFDTVNQTINKSDDEIVAKKVHK